MTGEVGMRCANIGFFTILMVLIKRNYLNIVRHPMMIRSKLIQSIYLSLFLGGLYYNLGSKDYTDPSVWNTVIGLLFYLCTNAMMMALSPVSLTFPLEKSIFLKEQDSKMYTVGQYFLARNLV
jgi:ATP-binding cassette subfamily G (WHITE) protein 2